MAGAAYGVDNLTVVLDRNCIQNDDFVENILPMGDLAAKWRAFGWHVVEIDGHDMTQIVEALESSREARGRPTMIVAETVKGKGVSYMENNPVWHGRAPNNAETEQALAEIAAAAAERAAHWQEVIDAPGR